MRVRRAVESDARAIAEVHVASWKAAYRGMLPDSFLDRLDAEKGVPVWTNIVKNPDIDTFVAVAGDRVVGFATLHSSRDCDADGNTGEISAIYVAPGAWRQGYGRSLMNAVLKQAKDKGFRSITLWVLEPNHRARRFYEALGFSTDGSTKTEKMSDNVALNEVRYRIDLQQSAQDGTNQRSLR